MGSVVVGGLVADAGAGDWLGVELLLEDGDAEVAVSQWRVVGCGMELWSSLASL